MEKNLFDKYNSDLCKIITTSAFLSTTQLPITDEQYNFILNTITELRKDLKNEKEKNNING